MHSSCHYTLHASHGTQYLLAFTQGCIGAHIHATSPLPTPYTNPVCKRMKKQSC